MRANVYFTREITPEKVVELYRALGVELPGKVAVKVHSGEKGNQNFLRPEFWCPMVEELIPEMSQGRHSNLGTVFFAVGFSVMMVLDVALG